MKVCLILFEVGLTSGSVDGILYVRFFNQRKADGGEYLIPCFAIYWAVHDALTMVLAFESVHEM